MLEVLDAFCGEGGVSVGWHRGLTALGIPHRITGVDTSAARLARYPFERVQANALDYTYRHGRRFHLLLGSPTCTGYSRGTAAIPDRLERYDRLIGTWRVLAEATGRPYVLENVADARPELRLPIMLCGRMFGLTTTDDDGTPLVLDRHRLFESNLPLMQPEHPSHDRAQVAGSYAGARRDKLEARTIRRGGYVPSADVQRSLLGVEWMSERGCQLSIPPAYTEWLALQLGELLVQDNQVMEQL